jgi:Fe-S cluster assembly protein SufD
MSDISPAMAAFDRHYDASRASLPGTGEVAVERGRRERLERLRRDGFPTRRMEAWRYTDLREFLKVPYELTTSDAKLSDTSLADPPGGAPWIVVVDGVLRPDLSRLDRLDPGATLTSFAATPGAAGAASEGPFADLNGALARTGVLLRIASGMIVDRPIFIDFLSAPGTSPTAAHPRLTIDAGANGEATIVERHAGPDRVAYFSNIVAEVSVGRGARIRHYRHQAEGDTATHMLNVRVTVAADAHYDSFTLSLGAALARTETRMTFAGPGGEGRLSGAYLTDGARVTDTTTVIDHAVPDCRSREVFKGVLDDRARGVFQGKIMVRPDAQRTDGYQLNRALLLSRTAEIDAKPELEIFADDVKCSHGAAFGEIDADALFYLRARGIDEATARAMLIDAFLAESLAEIADPAIRDGFAAAVADRLATRRGS